jgi:hypothetical protein
MQDIFIRIVFGVLVLSVFFKFYDVSKKLLEEVHAVLAFILIVVTLTIAYFTGGLLIK